ncbi:MAG: phosphatidylserine/phosphatidylglycerophosphate/cardiolipin synthase family protein [Candidatus Sericytochromatia bacterium]
MSISKRVILGGLAAILVGCAGGQGMPGPMAYSRMAAPGPLRSFAAAPKSLISTHFVNAYAETIAQNEPLARQDPNGPGRVLLAMIQSARQTLDGAFYDIGDDEVVDALIAAHRRGVRVRIVTDNENIFERTDVPLPAGRVPPLRSQIVRMQQAGIPLIDDHRSGLMHNKFLVADGQAVWMGSTNVTKSSLYNHNNNAMVLRIPQVAENYTYEFERMFVHKIFGVAPRQVPHPVIKVGNTTIRTFFSPRGGGQEAIVDMLANARQRISFMTFSFTDKTMADLMIRKRAEGLRVEGVYDQCLAYGQYSTKRMLSQNNILTRHDGNEALLHHKVILVDDTVIAGSYNFSSNADKSNNENMLIIQDAGVATAYAQEYDRVMRAAAVNHPPENKCPGDKPEDPVVPQP